MSTELTYAPWRLWSSDDYAYSSFDAAKLDTKMHPPKIAEGRSRQQLQQDIVTRLEGLKNVEWHLGDTSFEALPTAQIDAAIESLSKAIRKIDTTVWDKTCMPGLHRNPLHCFRRYAHKQNDERDVEKLSKSARKLHESLQHLDSALNGLLKTTSTLCENKPNAEDSLKQANLLSDVRGHLDEVRKSLPASKNRFNTKAAVIVLLAAASIAVSVCAFVASGGTIAAAILAFGIAVTMAGSINTILNQRFYQRDSGWGNLSKVVDTIHDLTVNQLEQRMNSVNTYHTHKGIENLTLMVQNNDRRVAQFQGEQRDAMDKLRNEMRSELRTAMESMNATMDAMRRDFEAARAVRV